MKNPGIRKKKSPTKTEAHFITFLLENPPQKRAVAVLCAIHLLLALMELLAFFFGGVFAVIVSRAWMCALLIFFVLSYKMIAQTIMKDVKEKNYFALAILAGVMALVFWGSGDQSVRSLNYESTQQLAIGLRAFSKPDWDFTSLGFLGYPMRQYLMLALPSLLFGRSMFMLHFSFDFIFATGILLYYCGFRRVFQNEGKSILSKIAAVIPLLAILGSPYVSEYIKIREQSILPPAFALMACGLFMVLYLTFSVESLVTFSFCAAFLGSMYTPGLAVAALAIYAIVFWNYKKWRVLPKDHRVLLYFTAFYIGTLLMLTIFSLSRTGNQLSVETASTEYILATLKQIVTETPYGLFRLFTPILLFFCVIAAGGFLKTYDGLIPLWALLTVLTAISMRGYTANSSFAIQRTMVVAPVIVAHFSIRVIGFKRPIQIAGSYALLALFSFAAIMNIVDPLPVLSTNIKFQAQSVNTYISGEVQKITRMPSFRDSKPVLLYYTDDVWDSNIYDYTCYLAPDVTAHSTYEGEIDRNYDPSGGLILYAKGSARIPESFIQQYGEPETFEQNIRGARVSFQRIIVFPY